MSVHVILGLIASGVNLAAMFILGRRGKARRWYGWFLYIFSQIAWAVYAIHGHLYEMLVLSVGATAIAIENLWSLNRRMRIE
jgi:hypothetical protein